jgi:hypothetical protein
VVTAVCALRREPPYSRSTSTESSFRKRAS